VRRTYVPVVVVACAALVALLVYGVVGAGESSTLDDAVAAGKRPAVPSRELARLDGGTASPADWRGRPLVVNFWASWCDPCEDEAPVLERAHERLKKRGGTVLGVTVRDQSDDSRAFARTFGLSFPSVRDVENELGDDFDRIGVPETFVVDREGRIVALRRGPVDRAWMAEALRRVGV
jgi:cytochrome c biogenesis protein CcmG/thiol:disulfide interchange protein DsbE